MNGSGAPPARFRLVAAVHLFLLRGNPEHLLLLRRANTGYADGRYGVIAGHLDGGETIIAAACREAHEETGIVVPPAALRIVGVMHRAAESPADNERIDYFLTAHTWAGTPHNQEPAKCDEFRWAPPDDLPTPMVPYVRHAIAAWRRGEPFTSFGWPPDPLG